MMLPEPAGECERRGAEFACLRAYISFSGVMREVSKNRRAVISGTSMF